MANISPFGPDRFVPFCGNEQRIHELNTGNNDPTTVVLEGISVPTYVECREDININVGAIAGFASQQNISTVYLMNNPEDIGARQLPKLGTGRMDTIADMKSRWFSPVVDRKTGTLAIYWNALTASQVTLDHSTGTDSRNSHFWTRALDGTLTLDLLAAKGIKRTRANSDRRLMRTPLFGVEIKTTVWIAGFGEVDVLRGTSLAEIIRQIGQTQRPDN